MNIHVLYMAATRRGLNLATALRPVAKVPNSGLETVPILYRSLAVAIARGWVWLLMWRNVI